MSPLIIYATAPTHTHTHTRMLLAETVNNLICSNEILFAHGYSGDNVLMRILPVHCLDNLCKGMIMLY